jgi:hypothetical protein
MTLPWSIVAFLTGDDERYVEGVGPSEGSEEYVKLKDHE